MCDSTGMHDRYFIYRGCGEQRSGGHQNSASETHFYNGKCSFGRITYEEGSRQLRKIETESMYQKDMAALLDYKNTDLAAAERMDIISLTKKSEVYDRISYEAHIKWTESYGEGTEIQVCLYEVGVKKNDGCLVLSAFDIR